ncbi:putative phage cell [Caudoviricetes sp.]|nr:putative phage cell [Caudoviricetes sp.]UOF82735.1 putative phage cell [Caudoviricetes sp.]
MTTRAALISEARRHLGTRFHHQGRAPGAGLDCLGLIVVSAKSCGLDIIDRVDYDRVPDGVSLVAEISKSLDGPFDKSAARLGSVLLVEFEKGLPQHVGFFTDIGILHALSFYPRRVVETRLDDAWNQKIVSCWELRGLED